MKHGKKFIFIGLILVLLSACSTISMSPDRSDVSFPSDGKYEILGRVTLENSQTNAGYIKLLEEAKIKYPESDDVVNIIIDKKTKTTTKWFIFTEVSNTYILSGIAIKFKN